jgi:CRISPR-associated protein Cmr2
MPSFFIYTLGPVQDFIAAAKRCRDLWFGSWLLSELSKSAAQAVAQYPGVGHGALIFPYVADPQTPRARHWYVGRKQNRRRAP